MQESQSRQVTRLWTLAQPTVSAYLTSVVRNFQDRDDILQNVAVSVADSFDRYDESRPFVAWAIGIARNEVREYLRKRHRDRHLFNTEALDAVAAAFTETAPRASAVSAFLSECLERLDDRSRRLCELRYADDLMPAAIAPSVRMSPNSVAKTLQRIRDRLRECIGHKLATEGS